MRFLGIVGLAMLGAAAGCADAKSTTINDDINWIAKCSSGGCTSFSYHDQKLSLMTADYDFKVSCKRSGNSIDITITDPGYEGDAEKPMHPPGEIVIRNGNATSNTCNVTVRDSMSYGTALVPLVGTCSASATSTDTSACVITGQFDMGEWDWVGSIYCSKLPNANLNTQVYTLESANSPGQPIQIAVDNCD